MISAIVEVNVMGTTVSAKNRLEQLKAQYEQEITSDRFVALTNPKNTALMEALVAWTCIDVSFDDNILVDENADLKELWQCSKFDTREFADTAGLDVQSALTKFRQMCNLKLIYPDGTANSKAISIVKIYVKGKVENL